MPVDPEVRETGDWIRDDGGWHWVDPSGVIVRLDVWSKQTGGYRWAVGIGGDFATEEHEGIARSMREAKAAAKDSAEQALIAALAGVRRLSVHKRKAGP